ncbi:Filamentous haemagglutinin family outer membrane protein associated with VreARI signalling system [Alloalcanivorax xenomutans]|uniref:filamentous haemagglutinin family protein n=1 Tax=Alloalcanivorax xenomutans TaxID=1094342 RepID=UPI0006D5B8DF|nr:filamentous haemagglutinin family protein [Alloalcanivorax xenomutans]CUR46614.1 Filamentous haemagglutinin family outer membrane protein associated with VreARI signalling system [Alloalcanivorax xenomutans]
MLTKNTRPARRTPVRSVISRKPLALAVASILAVGAGQAEASSPRPFSPEWFAAARGAAAQNRANTAPTARPLAQQRQARERLQHSINNVGRTAAAVAAQRAAQEAARKAAQQAASNIPNGLGEGGLKVDVNPDTAGWLGAKDPTQTTKDGHTTVRIEQTADKAILNWETFNVGRDTTVDFDQQANWAALNRVNDPNARPSQIQGRIQGDGTVMIVNRNGVVFSGSSQVNVRNLVAAAADISDQQFTERGLYVDTNGSQPTFTAAAGNVTVDAGARITTHEPESVTQGGGYVLLMGREVNNAGEITTRRGQTTLAAGEDFYIRKGAGTEANQASTTRGNEVASTWEAGSDAGTVTNEGLIVAREGDITLTGHDVRQQGVAMATTTVNTRGTVHLLNSASDTEGKVTLGEGAVTTVVIEDDGETALDNQRDALIESSAELDGLRDDMITGAFDNIGLMADRRDQSRVEIVSGGDVVFEKDSLTLATGGQIAVDAGRRTQLNAGSELDVSGSVGVKVAMESNNVLINVQGNEQRDSPDNRDNGGLNNGDVWVDRRNLIFVPAGTGGYETDRWYTAGGLLEVSGYLDTQGHGIGEWSAAGGTVLLGGSEVVTQTGSSVNLSGGTLDVQTGYIAKTWLKGADGRLYDAATAPASMLYTGIYQGYERVSERWGQTDAWRNPLIAPERQLENGYTVGRDAGTLIINAPTAVLEGDIVADVFQGERQNQAQDAGRDSYQQAQNRVARRGHLAVGQYGQYGLENAYGSDIRIGEFDDISEQLTLESDLSERLNTVWLDAGRLNEQRLGGLDLVSGGSISVESDLTLAEGGQLRLVSGQVAVDAAVTARGGDTALTNILMPAGTSLTPIAFTDEDGNSELHLTENGQLDARGLWRNGLLESGENWKQAYVDGGDVTIEGTQDVTLAEGSLVDVSSGAALKADGELLGGHGGDITLGANVPINTNTGTNRPGGGTLVLDGELRSYGVAGGGELILETGQAVVIGDGGLETNGVLRAGEEAPFDLTLAEDLVISAGQPLPFDYSYTSSELLPGETWGNAALDVSPNNPIEVAADWLLPATLQIQYYGPDGVLAIARPGGTVPAGSSVVRIQTAPGGAGDYLVPGDVFPDGLPLEEPREVAVAAGATLPTDLFVEAGSVVLPAGIKMDFDVRVKDVLVLNEADFQRGFSNYDINGHNGVLVSQGSQVDVTMSVLRLAEGAFQAFAYDEALETWQPELFLERPLDGELEQRGGASLALRSDLNGLGGAITVAEGARLEVDPSQSLLLSGRNQLTVDGTLRAQGGTIQVLSSLLNRLPASGAEERIEIGENAVLDASGLAYTATDARGRRYGAVLGGGEVVLGAGAPDDFGDSNLYDTSNLFVVVREGALIDVSGASAGLDLGQANPTAVASGGGSLAMRSSSGIYFDGELRADAGGTNASGGGLEVLLEGTLTTTPQATEEGSVLRNITLTQADTGSGYDDENLAYGQARFSVDALQDSGIDHLSLWARDAILFDGDVDLALGGSLSLTAVTLATPDHAAREVRLAAPHVHLAGRVNLPNPLGGGDSGVSPYLQFDNNAPLAEGDSQLSVEAALIDLGEGVLTFGARGSHDTPNGATLVELPGFADITLTSTGDIRLTGADLVATEALTLISQRLYPTTHSANRIRVGYGDAGRNSPLEDAVLRFRYYDEQQAREQAPPLSVYGYLSMQAPTIDQGGALYAPLGGIAFSGSLANDGGPSGLYPTDLYGGISPFSITNLEMDVLLRQSSLTSVSADGLVLPYGYLEGESYYYNDTEVRYDVGGNRGTEQNQRDEAGIHFAAATFEAEDGAVIDVSAGGELRGVGFTTGRGGSVDILNTALANAAPWHAGDADAQVYAIVPGLSDSQAPLDPALASHSKVGQRITIGDGVPGLPAGTYTLLPAEYALMPGGYRVELGGDMARYDTGIVASPAAGLYRAPVNTVNGLSGVTGSAPRWATVMSGDSVRRYGSYNETTLSEWVANTLAQFGDTRLMGPLLPEDVRPLSFDFRYAASGDDRVFSFNGELRNTQVEDGRGGMVALYGNDLEVVSATGERDEEDSGYITLLDEDLNQLGATVLGVGVNRYANQPTPISAAGKTVIRSGATLRAGSLLIGGTGQDAVVVESGAVLDSRGQGQAGWSAENGFLIPQVADAALLTVSNDRMQFGAASGSGTIRIEDGAGLYGEGTLALSASGGLEIGDISLAASDLLLSMEDINIGEEAALAAAEAQGVLSGGWQLNQTTLDGLLALGELESLSLQASDAINFIGSVSLDTYDDTGESQANLRFIGPAIYGLGDAGDTVTIRTDQFNWSGLGYASGSGATFEAGSVAPGEVIAGGAGTGTGAFRVEANEVMFGFNGLVGDQSANATLERLMLGFGDVAFQARDRITSDLYSDLSVYQQKNSDDTFSGGNLTLSAPVLTGQAGSEMAYRTGGNLLVSRPDNAAAVDPAGLDLGAQLSLEGNSVRVEGSIVAPSGKVAIESTEDLLLADGSLINVAGRAVEFFDVTRYSFGGAVNLESAEGNIQQAAGSRIDVSAPHSDAGKLEASAVKGTVDLAGELVARNSGEDPDGEGEGGTIRIKANTLPGFVAFNQRLTDGGFDYLRGFETNEGDLTLGEEVRAQHIEATANGGDLIVDGNLRAGGEYAGSIYLAAGNDLRVTNGSTLNASGDSLKVDSYGDPIEGSNRAIINLTSRDGRLALGDNVTLDVGAGGEARGTIDLNARRLGDPSATSATGNDVAVDAGDNLTVNGAKRVSVNGFWTYDDAPDDPDADPEGPAAQRVDQEYLDRIHEESKGFVNAALANDALQQRLAGLKEAAGEAFSLRPGVEIVSATEDGNLRIDGDLDFSEYRYGPDVDAAVHGSGTAGVFVMRAGGDLEVNGSVTDGFKLPPNTPDSSYYIDLSNTLLRDEAVTLPVEAELAAGWNLQNVYREGGSLPFNLTVSGRYFQVSSGTVLPLDVTVTRSEPTLWNMELVSAIVLGEGVTVTDTGTGISYSGEIPAGTFIENLELPIGSTIKAGNTLTLTSNFYAKPTTILAGTELLGLRINSAEEFNQDIVLPEGTVLPQGMRIARLKSDEKDPIKQAIWSVASLLPQDTRSWDVSLVAGSDLASANRRSVKAATEGDLILDNPHLVGPKASEIIGGQPGISVIRTGSGDLELIAARDYLQETPFGIYTAGTAAEASGAPEYQRDPDTLPSDALSDTYVPEDPGEEDAPTYLSVAEATPGSFATGGGNVRVRVGRDMRGNDYKTSDATAKKDVSDWLWTWSDPASGAEAWWINTGSYGNDSELVTFDGIGTLGGGNLDVSVGRDFGVYDQLADNTRLGGLSLAVASSGWINADGERQQYGGGDLRLEVGSIVNHTRSSTMGVGNGSVTNLRGDVLVQAGVIGQIWNTYLVSSTDTDPRPNDERLQVDQRQYGGMRLVLGDTRARVNSGGDLLINVENPDPAANGVDLWTDRTEAALLSTGGNVGMGSSSGSSPARFSVIAAEGTIYGQGNNTNARTWVAETTADGWLEFLAGDSIYTLGVSSAYEPDLLGSTVSPARFYAREGDIYQLYYGYYTSPIGSQSLINQAGRPAHVRAGRDIVRYGNDGLTAMGHYSDTDVSVIQAGRDLIYIDTQVVGAGTLELSAGRNFYQADSGQLISRGPHTELATSDPSGGADIVINVGMGEAGPDYQALIDAYLDPSNPADPDLALADQPDKVAKTYEEELETWLLSRYGDAALDGTDALSYFLALAPEQQRIFLREVYYAELREGGREYNDPDGDRYGSYLRGRRMIETLLPEMDSEAGTSGYDGDFTMFTTQRRNAAGDITGENSSLVRTEGGGDIQMLVPGGDLIIGLEAVRPESGDNGIMTQGSGDIQLFSQGDIALGLSRIMTTYGGDIFAWSNAGDINAGRGAKTTLVYTPPRRTYDDLGNVTLSPSVPSTGAGIATLAPIPEVPPGDIDLIAPLGVIDAGEAGIRVSGSINVAALQVVNAENIQVQGDSTGLPAVAAVNVGALTSASNAASSAVQAAEQVGRRYQQNQPSIISVEILGYGEERLEAGGDRTSAAPASRPGEGVVEVLGAGPLSANQTGMLTPAERQGLKSR